MSERRALVTGGAGFIGSHLVDRLIQDGFRVTVVDDLSSGRRTNLNPGASFHCLDLSSAAVGEVFQAERPQVVFHLAAQTSVIRSLKDPAADARANVLGSLQLLEQCKRFQVERVIYSSTGGALYGEPDRLPCSETHPVRPKSPYGASKYAVEGYLHCFSLLAGFKHTTLRYGNVYGPRQDPTGEAGVVAIFARLMLDGGEVVIYGDGQQERDFVYVGDVVEANIKALEQGENEFYNIGTGRSTNVNSIFVRLARLTDYRKEPKYEPSHSGDVFKMFLDIRKAERKLGWTPTVDVDTGLASTLQYFSEA